MKYTASKIAIVCTFAFGAAQVSAQQKLPEGVIAQQGSAQLTMRDIEAYAQRIPQADRAGFFDSPKRIETVIMNLLLQKQLATEARAEKLDNDAGVKDQIKLATDDALARVATEHYAKALKLPDFEALAQEYYLSHKDEFAVKGAIDVKHVLASSKERGDKEAKEVIGQVEAAALAHPDQFDVLVEKYSDDPSKKDNHGLIADAASGNTVGAFADAARALKKPGDISPVTKTEYGYHVLQLVEHKADTQRSFADVHDSLMQKLRDDYIERQSKDHTNEFRSKPLDADAELVASLRTHFLPAGAKLPSELAEEANEAARKKAAADAAH